MRIFGTRCISQSDNGQTDIKHEKEEGEGGRGEFYWGAFLFVYCFYSCVFCAGGILSVVVVVVVVVAVLLLVVVGWG